MNVDETTYQAEQSAFYATWRAMWTDNFLGILETGDQSKWKASRWATTNGIDAIIEALCDEH